MADGVILGIDGGGSKTLVAAADTTGRLRTLTRGAATSPLESPIWGTTLADLVRPHVRNSDLLVVAAALPAFGEVKTVSAAQTQVVADLFGDVPQRVLNDVDAAHLGAFGGGPGILILAGTGSMAWARDDAGTSSRAGGWGEIIGDEGSGHWIGKRVLEAVSKSIDGRGEQTTLTDGVLDLLGIDRDDAVSGLEGWVSTRDNLRTAIATLAPVATSAADAGDAVAIAIIERAADELALHVRTMEQRLGTSTIAWSYAGGLFGSGMLREAVIARVGRPPMAPRLPPIGGALLAAAQAIEITTDDDWIGRLARSIGDYGTRTTEAEATPTETGICEPSF